MTPALRPYQTEDVAAVLAAHRGHRCVIGRAATGLGKAVEIAALAAHYAKDGRVMVLVDVTKLVRQLAETIEWFTGQRPGVEMGDERADNGGGFVAPDRIVVSTVQTQYSGGVGQERFRRFYPSEFSAVLLDECELFLAPKARSVVEWYMGNADLRVYGCTATPFRTDGKSMGELFDHVAFDRDILWGIREGWLVKARQAFVRVSLDFSTLKVRKDEEGDEDYSEAEIAARINNEQTLIELAKGIVQVAGDRKSIVVCPDVASAKAVAHYLEAERVGCARCVYGELGDTEKEDVMEAHKRGEFQFLTSVMMLTKGYDDFTIRAVFNCRKTKSKRLYQQILGRGTRPWRGILDGHETPEARVAAIGASPKSDMIMANLVGVEDEVREVTLIDILGNVTDPRVAERAKQLAKEQGMETEEAVAQAEIDVELDREVNRVEAEETADRLDHEDAERLARRRVQVEARVETEYRDDLDGGGGMFGGEGSRIPERQLGVLRKAKLTEDEIAALTAAQASGLSRLIVYRWKAGLCSYRQAKLLGKHGYAKAELAGMRYEDASAAIEALKSNGWQRPRQEAVA